MRGPRPSRRRLFASETERARSHRAPLQRRRAAVGLAMASYDGVLVGHRVWPKGGPGGDRRGLPLGRLPQGPGVVVDIPAGKEGGRLGKCGTPSVLGWMFKSKRC